MTYFLAVIQERVFQLPLFEKIVEMDGNARFRPVPPERIKPLYNRILRGGQWIRMRKGEQKARKDRECNTPEAVYKAKLVSLLLKTRFSLTTLEVEWQSVQKRYAEMFADENSEDGKLMETFKAYGLEFSQSNLNNEVCLSFVL
ncbi:unnamed protein product [Strongylus vulgaris]|uniref:Uncharacterized protein n=1 Tax=Strongylus vulgaris TaxID=40348 RepID=A0A3P7I1K7_STRVU|nr:unnamed protein product [Strongylus vulgaris]